MTTPGFPRPSNLRGEGAFRGPAERHVRALQNAVKAVESGTSPVVDAFNAPGYLYGGAVRYTSSGTFSKASYPGLRAVVVEVVGAGGGGGGIAATGASENGAAGGGGGGGYARKLILASALGASETVTVGVGGVGGVGANDGQDGGSSAFGSHCSGSGGERGRAGVVTTSDRPGSIPGIGGAGSGGDVSARGGAGEPGYIFASANRSFGGLGGASHLAGSARGGNALSAVGSNGGAGNTFGGGGAGAASRSGQSAFNGGAGGDGIVIVHLYF